MNINEDIRAVFEFKRPSHMPKLEWGCWWDETLGRWHADGLDPELRNVRWYSAGIPVNPTEGEIGDFLGLDPFRIIWPRPVKANAPHPRTEGEGLVKHAQEYRELKKFLFPEEPVELRYLKELAELKQQGRMALWMWLDGFFWFPRTLLGIEDHLYAFYDQPELLLEMNRDLLNWYLSFLPAMFDIITPDVLLVAEDLSYNHGPMLSQEKFEEICAPFYRELVPLLKSRGIHPLMDSDGDVTSVIDWCEKVGIEGIGPLERMAGVDLVEIRRCHPDFLLLGGFDKTVMHLGEAEMRREFERILPVMKSGGYLPMPDHQTPPACSLQNYRLFRKLFDEYAMN